MKKQIQMPEVREETSSMEQSPIAITYKSKSRYEKIRVKSISSDSSPEIANEPPEIIDPADKLTPKFKKNPFLLYTSNL